MADDDFEAETDEEELEEGDLTTLEEMAVIIHEMYEAFLSAGFNSRQALWIAATSQTDLTVPGE